MKGGGGVYGAQAQQRQFREADDSFFYEELPNSSSQITSNNVNGDFWLKLHPDDHPDEDQIIFQGRLWQKSGKHKKWTPYHFELYSSKLIRVDLSVHKQSDASKNEQQIVDGNIMNQPSTIANKNNQSTTGISADGQNPGGGETIGQQNPTLHKENSSNKDNVAGHSNPTTINMISNINDADLFAEYIPINQCFLKKIKYSDNSYSIYKYGIRLQRGEYKSELFTENSDTFNKWHDEIKRYCILPKFNKKYKALTKLKISVTLPNSVGFFKCFKFANIIQLLTLFDVVLLTQSKKRFSDSSQYCVRTVEKYSLSDASRIALLKEIQILRTLDSPFLCRLYEVYEDESNIYIVTELFQGKDLKAKLMDSQILDEKTISEIMWRLLQGLHHMHSRNIFHRDIKLENIQFRNPQNSTDVCLSNFFMADFIGQKGRQAYKKCGTAGFIAPEIFKSKIYDAKVDIFSLGVVFYILIFGRMPFDSPQAEQVILLNEQGDIDFTSVECVIKCTSSAIDLLKKMLQKDPAQRSDAFQLINHTWFIKMKNRGEDGIMRNNNLYGIPTLSTIQERASQFIEIASHQDPFADPKEKNPPKICEENNNGFETVNMMMRNLNSQIFTKAPSKPRHDIAFSKPF